MSLTFEQKQDYESYRRKNRIIVKKLNQMATLPERRVPQGAEAAYTPCPGWDLELVERTDDRSSDEVGRINKFHTYISVTPPYGHHIEIHPRYSLLSNGYMMQPIIVDPDYAGEIIIPLFKFEERSDLDLPYAAVQMILVKNNPAYLYEAEAQEVREKAKAISAPKPQQKKVSVVPKRQAFSKFM